MSRDLALGLEADARTRTGDPFITSEVLYQLSYVGGVPNVAAARGLLVVFAVPVVRMIRMIRMIGLRLLVPLGVARLLGLRAVRV